MTNHTSNHTTSLDNLLSWIGRPVPVRHSTDDDGRRRLVFAQVDPHDLDLREVDVLCDSDRLALGAGLLRLRQGRRLRHRLEPTERGQALHRRLRGLVALRRATGPPLAAVHRPHFSPLRDAQHLRPRRPLEEEKVGTTSRSRPADRAQYHYRIGSRRLELQVSRLVLADASTVSVHLCRGKLHHTTGASGGARIRVSWASTRRYSVSATEA